MVLRMEMRWAERRGFEVELLEASRRGRRPASSPRRSAPRARTPTACSAPRRACTGSCACRRSTPPTAARRASPASRSRRSSRTPATSRSTTTTCRSTPTAPRAPAASTSTRPTRRCASRTARAGSSCSARTSARSPPTRTTAMTMLRAKLLEREERERQEEIASETRRGAGRQLRLADPLLRAAPVHDGQGPPHRLRDGRRPARARRRPRRLRPRLPAARPRSERAYDAGPGSRRAADRAVPRRRRRLRLPRLRRASTSPATRAARAPTRAALRRSATARCCSTSRRTSRASTSGPSPTPYERAERSPPRPTAPRARGF